MHVWSLLAALVPGTAEAQSRFQLTITNTSAASWDQGVLAVLPGAGAPNALLPIAQAPTSGDTYDTYTYVHASCDPAGEDDGNGALLISRWPSLTTNVNAFLVGPLAPAAAQVVDFTANPGDVVSFVARVTASGDDAVVMTAFGSTTDATVDLFDGLGQPLTSVPFAIVGVDVNDLSPTGGGGACAGTCPPSVPCYVSAGGNAGVPGAQPVTGGCVAVTWWADGDGDGFGAGPSTQSCAPPAGSALVGGDCNDADPLVTDTVWWYRDDDADGYGESTSPISQCAQPVGFVVDGTDCDDADPDNWASCAWCVDTDGDTWFVACDAFNVHKGPDCDDDDALVQQDLLWWPDDDQDGHGDPGTVFLACDPGVPAALVGDDCDDTDPTAFPGATEVCDGDDEDCDLLVDDADPDVVPDLAWHADDDQDGYGDPLDTLLTCNRPPGRVADGTDCDDADPDNWMSCATCVDADGDFDFAGCDAYLTRDGPDCDDTNPAYNNGVVWHHDADGDGAGDPLVTQIACLPPPGFVSTDDDCDDTDPTAFPGATEVCDGDDEDCDALVDDDDADTDPATMTDWHADSDADGYGAAAVTATTCLAPPGLIDDDTDCDDADRDNWTGCLTCVDADGDGAFFGCDAYTTRPGPDCQDDDPLLNGGTTWYADVDGDGFGDPTDPIVQCAPVPGTVLDDTDCDDTDATAFPGAPEVCDGDDDDCDLLVDDADPNLDPLSMADWHEDADGDGYGGAVVATACTAPPGLLPAAEDCDDADPDNWVSCLLCVDGDGDGDFVGCDAWTTRAGPDCDDADPALNSGAVWFLDFDGDGAGDPLQTAASCTQPPGHVATGFDCDDADPTAFPGGTEICDGDDDDCDGLVDDADPDVDLGTSRLWFADDDGDGYGDASDSVFACGPPPGRIGDDTDCDDADADNWASCATCEDLDGDGAFVGCDAWATRPGPDCDDDDATRYPDALEVCAGGDEDCDGLVGDADDSVVDADLWFADTDLDGWGNLYAGTLSCVPLPDTTLAPGDCDDSDPTVYPYALELCDGVDDDCDGLVDDGAQDAVPWFLDDDGDGFGDATQEVLACDPPADHVGDDTDCDDGDATVWPDAPELCDGLDNDCDGTVDDGVVDVPWYPDRDGDGWGDPEGAVGDCAPPPDTTDRPGDCDDTDPDVNPDGTEVAGNGVDEDCDGADLPGDGPSSRDWEEPRAVDPLETGCGCATGGSGSAAWLVALAAVGLTRVRAARRAVRA